MEADGDERHWRGSKRKKRYFRTSMCRKRLGWKGKERKGKTNQNQK